MALGSWPLRRALRRAERSLTGDATMQQALDSLQALSLDDFAAFLWSMPDSDHPRLSRALPPMAPAETQERWTGASGARLLSQSVDFARLMMDFAEQQTGRPLGGARVLDYGCGYGRFARLLTHRVQVADYYGVDPWQPSIDACRAAGLGDNVQLSSYLPGSLPVESGTFDLAFAFSVFTHLSERATTCALPLLVDSLKPDGALVITIRPTTYWDVDQRTAGTPLAGEMKAQHSETGFAFLPQGGPTVDGDITYGDTSMSLQWLVSRAPGAEIVSTRVSVSDPHQLCVMMRRRTSA